MKKLKIPELKDPMEAIRWVMLITFLPFILYMMYESFTQKPIDELTSKKFYQKQYNDSYLGKICEKEHDGNRWFKFRLNTGRSVYASRSAYDAAEVGHTLWKKTKRDTLYIKMPDGALLGFDEVSKYRDEYLKEVKKLVK
jgi:hypothetical protein